MWNLTPPLILAAFSLSVAACSTAGGSSLYAPVKAALTDDSSASRGVQAVLRAASDGRPSTAGLARGDGKTALRSTDGSGDVDATTACEDGGTVSFTGHLDIDLPEVDIEVPEIDPDNPPNPDDLDDIDPADYIPSVTFDFHVTFDGCTVDGVTIDGTMTYSMDTDWDEVAQSVEFTWDYHGAVDFSGAVDGSCEFDFGGSAEGAEDWADADPEDFEGDVCGFEADAGELGE